MDKKRTVEGGISGRLERNFASRCTRILRASGTLPAGGTFYANGGFCDIVAEVHVFCPTPPRQKTSFGRSWMVVCANHAYVWKRRRQWSRSFADMGSGRRLGNQVCSARQTQMRRIVGRGRGSEREHKAQEQSHVVKMGWRPNSIHLKKLDCRRVVKKSRLRWYMYIPTDSQRRSQRTWRNAQSVQ